MTDKKKCIDCKKTKAITAFYANSRGEFGAPVKPGTTRPECKQCSALRRQTFKLRRNA